MYNFSCMLEQLIVAELDKTNKGYLNINIWSLNLNLGLKPTAFNPLLDALAQIIAYCHVMIIHHIVALHWLCSFSIAGICPLSVDVVLTLWSLTPMKSYYYLQKCQVSKIPLFIPIQSHSPASALFYCIRTTTLRLLHGVVVEPLSSAWPIIATVNRWKPTSMSRSCLSPDVPTHSCLFFMPATA